MNWIIWKTAPTDLLQHKYLKSAESFYTSWQQYDEWKHLVVILRKTFPKLLWRKIIALMGDMFDLLIWFCFQRKFNRAWTKSDVLLYNCFNFFKQIVSSNKIYKFWHALSNKESLKEIFWWWLFKSLKPGKCFLSKNRS